MKTQTGFSLSIEIHEALDAAAKERGLSKTKIVEQALTHFLAIPVSPTVSLSKNEKEILSVLSEIPQEVGSYSGANLLTATCAVKHIERLRILQKLQFLGLAKKLEWKGVFTGKKDETGSEIWETTQNPGWVRAPSVDTPVQPK